jgi:hypothetical protein
VQIGNHLVDRIIKEADIDIEREITSIVKNIPDNLKRKFYQHINSLILNVLVNKLSEISEDAIPRIHACNDIVKELMKNSLIEYKSIH